MLSWFRPPPPPPPPPPAAFVDDNLAKIIIAIALVAALSACVWFRGVVKRCSCKILAPGSAPAPLASTECLKNGFATRKLPEEVDVLVIGSGISGLLTAALLSKLGHRVVVLEQHDQAGGCTHTFEEEGYEFDVGLHYVGDILGVLLNAGTTGTIEWACTGPIVDEVVSGKEKVPIMHPKRAFLQEVHARFPKERSAINAYSRKLDTSRLALGVRFALKCLPRFLHAALMPLVDATLPLTSTLEVLTSLTTDAKLVNLLSYVWGTFGLPPSRSPFAMTAIIQTHYFNGAFYPVGGCSQLAARLVPTITAAGGSVLVRAPVSSLLLDGTGGACIGAVVKGHEIRARRVVSSAGVLNTIKLCPAADRHRLAAASNALRDAAPLRCDNVSMHDSLIEPSNAFAYLFIGLEASASDGGGAALTKALIKHNLWVLPSWQHEADSALPPKIADADAHPLLVFISSPSAKDPAYSDRFPGKHVLVALAPTRYEYWAERGGDRVHHRGKAYDDFKSRMQQRMLSKVLEQLPEVAPHVKHVTLGSPLSNNFFLGTAWGEAYGLEHSADRFGQTFLRPTTPIPNLYFSGQDAACCGVAGGAIAAFLTASTIDLRVPVQHAGTLAAMATASM